MDAISIIPILGVPEIKPGDDIGREVALAMRKGGLAFLSGDVLVVKSKIVSKAEGRLVDAESVIPSPFAVSAAKLTGRDARYMELVLRESLRIVRMGPGIIICETRHGFVLANAGVDNSNIASGCFALLPEDPDASATRIRMSLQGDFGAEIGVIISDTFGRPWREGQCDLAIGISGIHVLRDDTKTPDSFGKALHYSKAAVADELASAAELLCGKAKGVPAVLIRGYGAQSSESGIRALIMPRERDLFR